MFSTLPISPGSSKRYKADPHCELNRHQEPAGSTPIHEVFEEYANEQDSWIEHFVPTLEKLLSNGYTRYIMLTYENTALIHTNYFYHSNINFSDDLTENDYDSFDIQCPRIPKSDQTFGFTNCYSLSKTFGIAFSTHEKVYTDLQSLMCTLLI